MVTITIQAHDIDGRACLDRICGIILTNAELQTAARATRYVRDDTLRFKTARPVSEIVTEIENDGFDIGADFNLTVTRG